MTTLNLPGAIKPLKSRILITGQQGYTLLEVLFSILIIVAVLLGLSGMTVMVMQSNSTNDFTDIAVDLAQDKLEQLKNALFTSTLVADVNSGNNSDLESTANFDYQENGIDELGRPGGVFARTWNIADNVPKAGMKTVVVIVTWVDGLGSHRVSLRTVV